MRRGRDARVGRDDDDAEVRLGHLLREDADGRRLPRASRAVDSLSLPSIAR